MVWSEFRNSVPMFRRYFFWRLRCELPPSWLQWFAHVSFDVSSRVRKVSFNDMQMFLLRIAIWNSAKLVSMICRGFIGGLRFELPQSSLRCFAVFCFGVCKSNLRKIQWLFWFNRVPISRPGAGHNVYASATLRPFSFKAGKERNFSITWVVSARENAAMIALARLATVLISHNFFYDVIGNRVILICNVMNHFN